MVKISALLTTKDAQDIDRRASESLGISTLILMENAGRSVAEEAMKMLGQEKKVAVFCGRGNNGGDGLVAARHLLVRGIRPDIYLCGYIGDVKNEAKVNLDIILKLKHKIFEIAEENLYIVKGRIQKYNLIIDALFGVGLSGQVRGVHRDLIGIINISKAKVLSVDIPSGLDATTGDILGCCVRADKTITFVAKKRGMVLGKAAQYCGKIMVKDLGAVL
jgi:NAD(P)H-hydrate epimerase